MTDELLAEQLRYYRLRAGEYDATAYGDAAAAAARIERLVDRLRPTGEVLELACGTGMWTPALARHASSLTAVDAAPETIEIARRRPGVGAVRFQVADIFAFSSPMRFDTVFFSAWLSHVPDDRVAKFWQLLRGLLVDGGRVLFVDEHTDERPKESYGGDNRIAERELSDGSRFRIVKNFVDPPALTSRLAELGWRCVIERDGSDWVVGEARPEL
jgi:demethylmenaquinone methyltransferase/2-methoxy-6-polyprenyl-1,4-benzoquinol methylase